MPELSETHPPANPEAPPPAAPAAPSEAPRRRVELPLRADDGTPIYFASDDAVLRPSAEAELALALIPAMRRGVPVALGGALSPRLAAALPTIQQIYASWRPELSPVPVSAPPGAPGAEARGRTGRVATFFSGGVDSFYTLLKHQDEITDLVFVHGLDIHLENAELRASASASVHEVGRALGLRVLEVETNLRAYLNPHLGWRMAHGAGLAAVAHAVGHALDRVYVPATHTYSNLVPLGTHPVLDPLWSTERLEIAHDGCEARRLDKVARIAESDVALRTLRVCYLNRQGAYNCGRCEKCVRTMVGLRIAGALDRCTTFAEPLTVERVRALRIHNPNTRVLIADNVAGLRARGDEPALVAALEAVLNPPPPPPPPLLRELATTVLRRAPRLKAAVRRLRAAGR